MCYVRTHVPCVTPSHTEDVDLLVAVHCAAGCERGGLNVNACCVAPAQHRAESDQHSTGRTASSERSNASRLRAAWRP
jgi:hypothetical protein